MELPVKRRRNNPTPDSENSDTKRSKFDDEFSSVLSKLRDSPPCRKTAKRLKTMLADESRIKSFVSTFANIDTLIAIFARHTAMLGTLEYNHEVHQLIISTIANCCFTVPLTGGLIRKANRNFLDLVVRLFESTSATVDVKASTCRLIANLCSNKELVSTWISSNKIIFDRIALLLESTDVRIVKQCIRIFSIIANFSFTRIIMLSNAGFYLGKLLENTQFRDDVVKILKILLKRHPKVLDRQLSSSGCSEHVISMFFDESTNNRQFVIDVFSNTVCIREQMEVDSFLDSIMESEVLEKNRMLAAFAQSAWGRAKLRTSGALDALISAFSKSESRDERHAIVTSFRHFSHDMTGMKHVSENALLVNTVVDDVTRYVDENRSECKPTVDMEFVRKLSRKLEELSASGDGNGETSQINAPTRRHKDFFSMWSYETPQTSPRQIAPSASPSYFSPSSSGASSPIRRAHFEDELSDVESIHDDREELPDDEKRVEKLIIECELWLLSQLSQDDTSMQCLIRSDVVDCVISYLRNTRHPEFRTYRILRRMATLRTYVYRLLDLEFHIRILTGLCASPCRMLKYSKPCRKCDVCTEHGREILREFASHVDNSYGDAHINSQFVQHDFVARTKAAIAKIVLVKERIRLAKFPAVDELFESLLFVLKSKENYEEFGKIRTYQKGPTLGSQIIGALSILIYGQRIRELCENDAWYFAVDESYGECHVEKLGANAEQLIFVDEHDEIVASGPMERICENSAYFQVMFSSGFVETRERIRKFQLDSDPLVFDAFRTFIHILSGCTSACTNVKSAEECANLLELSDHYLCSDIAQRICADDGALRTFLNGSTLPVLLPVALTSNAHPTLLDTVFLTLMRFASNNDVDASLGAICTNPTLVNTFVTNLRAFLTQPNNY